MSGQNRLVLSENMLKNKGNKALQEALQNANSEVIKMDKKDGKKAKRG